MSDLAEMLSSAKTQGYKEGRADAIDELMIYFKSIGIILDKNVIEEQLKEQSNE